MTAIYRKSADGKTASVDDGKFGVVEPNHLSAPRNGQVYAQLPADDSISVLENGMFVDYDYATGTVKLGGKYMVFNEEKLYDERKQSHRDYAMKAADFYDGKMYPRVFAMHAGDIFTTNTVKDGTNAETGAKLYIGTDGFLTTVGSGSEFAVVADANATLPDGITPALKIQVKNV